MTPRFMMVRNIRSVSLVMAGAICLSACGGGTGDADENVTRTLFAAGEVFETTENSTDVIADDVSANDLGEGLSYALADTNGTGSGSLVFNADGTFEYTPTAGFVGDDQYSYVVTQASTGDTASAVLTIRVENDFATADEAGWTLAWSDEFEGDTLDETKWSGVNASVADGNLVISSEVGVESLVNSVATLPYGRFEASIFVAAGSSLTSAFRAIPMADIYDGNNRLNAFEASNGDFVATAHYGLGLVNGLSLNDDFIAAATSDFHTYAVEWNEDLIRWYYDGVHIFTLDAINLWAYNNAGDDVVSNVFAPGQPAGPFNQDLKLELTLSSSDAEPTELLVDYIRVSTCNPSVAPSLTQCAANTSSIIDRDASDRIPSVTTITTELFTDGVFDEDDDTLKISDLEPLSWHYTDVVVEATISNFNSPTIEMITLEDAHNLVIDVSHPVEGGDANVGIATPGIEFIGHNTTLSFDMYIDSENTFTESFDIRMETGWPYMGVFTWTTSELQLDSWVTYTMPVADFINTPFIAPDWLNWIDGVVEGDLLPLDPTDVNALLVIEFHDGVHFQLDNIKLTCTSSESCVQGPLAQQATAQTGPAPIRVEAEAFTAESGTQLEDTADEGGGQNVGFIDAGDFLEYNFTAPGDGTYTVDYRLASSGGSAGFELSIDNVVVDTQTVDDTGGWQNWATQSSVEFDLSAGDHSVRLDFIGGSTNVNWLEFFPPAFEIFLEAEAFDAESGTQLEDTADEGGGQNVGFIDPGDFLEYTVNIPADGTYFIEYRLASSGGSDGFETSIGGQIVDSQTVDDTGGWQNWASQNGEVALVAGEQTLRLDFIGGATNVNWIKISN
jgi:hypothetical protein